MAEPSRCCGSFWHGRSRTPAPSGPRCDVRRNGPKLTLANGTGDMRLRHELSSIDDGLAELVRRGEYVSVERVDLGPSMSKAWLQVSHDIRLPGGKTVKSYSFMRVQNGYFVKLRISGPPAGSQARLPGFLLGVSRAIGLLGR